MGLVIKSLDFLEMRRWIILVRRLLRLVEVLVEVERKIEWIKEEREYYL